LKKHKELGQKSASIAKELDALNLRMGKIDEELINLREQKAYAQPRSHALSEKLKSRFGEKDGFFGKASELCTYKPEYAYAVEAAAGSRFEYLVVDSIDTANKMIGYMKESGLGRATFIPIKELRQQADAGEEKGVKSMVEFVKFDKAYERYSPTRSEAPI